MDNHSQSDCQEGLKKVGTLDDKIDDLNKKFNTLNTSFTEMNLQMREMYTAIVGNEKLGHEGIVHRVAEIEKTIEMQEKTFESIRNKAIGFSVGFASVFTVILEIIKEKFFK